MSINTGSRSVSKRVVLVLVALLTWGTVGQAVEAAPKRPDLVVPQLGAPPSWAARGSSFTVPNTVRNKGKARAGRSVARFYLSTNKKRSKGDIRLGGDRKVKALKPGKASKGGTKLTVPAKAKPGLYHLLACADDKNQVRESNEKNNCKAARKFLVDAPDPSPDPLSVTPVLDTDRAVSTTVQAEGNDDVTLETDGADGTSYKLVMPAGALEADTEITMTPLSSVGGFPFSGGLIGGVDLKPEGLRLYKPAVLTISPPGEVPVESQDAFAYAGAGAQFRLYPLAIDTTKIAFSLLHFSGYGVGEASTADLVAQLERIPANAEFRAEQEAGDLTGRYRRGEIDGAEFADGMQDLLQKQYYKEIRPALETATKNADAAPAAVAAFIAWMRTVDLLDLGLGAEYQQGINLAQRAIKNYFETAYSRCKAGNDRKTQLDRMLSAARTAELIGGAISILGPGYFDKIEDCAAAPLPKFWDGEMSGTFVYSGGTTTEEWSWNFVLQDYGAQFGDKPGQIYFVVSGNWEGSMHGENPTVDGTCVHDASGTWAFDGPIDTGTNLRLDIGGGGSPPVYEVKHLVHSDVGPFTATAVCPSKTETYNWGPQRRILSSGERSWDPSAKVLQGSDSWMDFGIPVTLNWKLTARD